MCNVKLRKCWGQQNTHWYIAEQGKKHSGQGFTANPEFAKAGEVERIGLHDCFVLQCWRA